MAVLVGQVAAFLVYADWFGPDAAKVVGTTREGVAIALSILVATPIEVALLVLFARRSGHAAAYLGLIWPRRAEVVIGIAATVAYAACANGIAWLSGQAIVTPFQIDIYRSASAAGWLAVLWLAVVVVAPIGEELLFRGFLFRGWLRTPRDTWPVIVGTALLWTMLHVQYDWFVIGQIFVFGLLLGWMRWATGSVILTILLHALVNAEAMIETFLGLKWLT
jgi:membrane protease YdiL (CAAX protease family)